MVSEFFQVGELDEAESLEVIQQRVSDASSLFQYVMRDMYREEGEGAGFVNSTDLKHLAGDYYDVFDNNRDLFIPFLSWVCSSIASEVEPHIEERVNEEIGEFDPDDDEDYMVSVIVRWEVYALVKESGGSMYELAGDHAGFLITAILEGSDQLWNDALRMVDSVSSFVPRYVGLFMVGLMNLYVRVVERKEFPPVSVRVEGV